MKKVFMAAALCCAASAHAEYTVTCPKGDVCGVLSSRIERQPIEMTQSRKVMTATADLTANATNITTNVGKPVMARGTHTACFETFFTTEGDYKFVLDVGGHQTVVTEHILLPAHQRTCVSHETYYQMAFPSTGTYQYSATSSGYTQMAGWRSVRSDAYVFVR